MMHQILEPDMSPKAVRQRLREVGELYQVGMRLLGFKPVGYVDPVAASKYLDSSAETAEISGFQLREQTNIGMKD